MSVVCPHGAVRHAITIRVDQAATKKAGLKWESVDWSKPTKQIATEMNVEPSLVSLWRGKLAPETKRAAKAQETPVRKKWWGDVDWSQSDTEIAKEKGKSRTTVIYHRGKRPK